MKKSREIPAMDCAWDKEVLGGFFNKTALEGVRATHGRWIVDERAGLKEKKKKQKKTKRREREGVAHWPETNQNSRTRRPPWLAGRSSSEQADGKLRCTVFDSV